ncbi:MAG: ComEC/Rec2 family competence protein, partial [Clostridia bacterium]|nr:ComEC/Rec2 family competence protein [Clostridia bacterium]
FILVVLAFFGFGIGWYFFGMSTFQGKEYLGEVQVSGRISDDISYSTYGNSATVILKDVMIDEEQTGNIRLQISLSKNEEIKAGDKITFKAEVENAKLFTFSDFNLWYYRDGTPYTSQVSCKNIEFDGSSLTFDESFRLKVKNILYENMGEENGAVAYAVLFGDKNDIDKDTKEVYKSAGIIHLLTVSGLHVGFLIVLLGFVLKKCHVRGILNFLICAFVLGIYAYLCGFAPSVLRAGIMGLVLLSTKLSGKCYDSLNSLGLAGIIILLISPLSALDNGFLMSFFCVLAIFLIYPWLAKIFRKVLPKFVANSLALSISAQVGILPFVSQFYSTLNLLTPFANLLVIPLFSVVYPFLFVSVLITLILPFMGFLLSVSGWGFSLSTGIAEFFTKTNLIINLKPINVFLVALVCILAFLLSRYFMANKKVKTVCCSSLAVVCAIVFGCLYIPTKSQSAISVCYNYSNEIVLLTNSHGNSVLVDAGYLDFTQKVLKSQNVKSVVATFVLQDTTVNIDTVREVSDGVVIRGDNVEGYDEEVLSTVGTVAGFSYVYKFYDKKLAGLEISFDDTKVFILKNKTHSVDALKSLAESDYDFVILDKKSSYSLYFSENSNVLC